MKNYLFSVIILLIFLSPVYAQNVGIGTNTPDASALLEIKSNSKGILVPRTSSISRLAILNPAKGLMLYDTTTGSFWFHNGAAWAQIGAAANSWALTGNGATNPATSFLGTTDNLPLRFRLNNTWAGELNPITGNVYLGFKAGEQTSTSYSNIAIGVGALRSNTSRHNIVAIGDSALYNNGTGVAIPDDGSYNTAIGSKALYSNNIGAYNTAIGSNALFSNTTGGANNAYGESTLFFNTKGNYNIADGQYALFLNTTASKNIAIGVNALFSQSFNNGGNEWESANVAIGFGALTYNNPTSTTNGISNTAVGTYAMYNNSIGYDNTALGAAALYFNDIGSFNSAIGRQALYSNTSGNENTATGFKALRFNEDGNYNTAYGSNALYSNTHGNDNTAIGDYVLYYNTIGKGNTAIGDVSLTNNSTANYNTAIGARALQNQSFNNNNVTYESNNVAVGYQALYSNNPTSTIDGINNTAVGTSALMSNTTGDSNTANGFEALFSNTSGYENTANGYQALYSNDYGFRNTANGYQALYSNITGSNNTAYGNNALANTVGGSGNIAIGFYSGPSSTIYGNIINTVTVGYFQPNNQSNQAVIGNTSTQYVGGYVNWTNYLSDARFKKNVQENVKGLDFILQLRPVTYNLDIHGLNKRLGVDELVKKTNHLQQAGTDSVFEKAIVQKEAITYSGFIAQEVELAAQKAGYDFSGIKKPQNENDNYGLAYSDFVVPLVKAVQELSIQTTTQKKTIDQLQNKITTQQQQYEILLKRLEAFEKKN